MTDISATVRGWLGFPQKAANSTYTYLVHAQNKYWAPMKDTRWKSRVETMWDNKQNINAAFFKRSVLKAGAVAGVVLTALFQSTITQNWAYTTLFTTGLMCAIVKGLQVDRSAAQEMERLERDQQFLKNLLKCDPDTNTRSEWNQFEERESPTDPRVNYRIIELDGCECIEKSADERV